MKKTPAVDTVLAQLNNLNEDELQLIIQAADDIRQNLEDPPPPPEVIEPLAQELRDISEIDITIPIQLQFQLQTRLKYQGPGHSPLDSLHYDTVTVKEQGKCTIPVDMVLIPNEGAPEGLLEEILMSFEYGSSSDTLSKKTCPALTAYMARIAAFEKKLTEEAKKLDMDKHEMYDSVDWAQLPKKGKKKAGKKRAARISY